MVITSVADRIPAQIERLVYLDAFLPQHGESLSDLIRRAVVPEVVPVYLGHFYSAMQNGGLVPPIPGEMFGQTPPTTARMLRHCNAQSLATLTLPALLSGAGAIVPKSYILAGNWEPSPFPAMAAEFSKAGLPVQTIPGGHCLMMDAPQAVADALLSNPH
jgi:pimeloyl-ACP methyl ester carboxylesterase